MGRITSYRRAVLFLSLPLAMLGQDQTQPLITYAWSQPPSGCNGSMSQICFPAPGVPTISSGVTYQDPNFGGLVRILARGVHQYASPSDFSATGKYLHTLDLEGHSFILDAVTGVTLRAGAPYPDPRWSSFDDDLMYFVAPTGIQQYRVSTGQTTTYLDYRGRFTAMNNGGTGDLSKDDWIVFFSQPEHTVCAVDLNQKQDYCADYAGPDPNNRVPTTDIDYALITKGRDSQSGQRYVILMATPAAAVFAVNEDLARLDLVYKPEYAPGLMTGGVTGNLDNVCDPGDVCLTTPHADTFEDSDGQQYLLFAIGREDDPIGLCDLTLASFRFNSGILMMVPESLGGGRRDIFVMSGCGATWPGVHYGCARQSPYCVISTDNAGPQNGNSPYWNELFVVRGNGLEIRRLALHQSTEAQYWDQPRASISPLGDLVFFNSNFGNVAGPEWLTLVKTGFSAPTW